MRRIRALVERLVQPYVSRLVEERVDAALAVHLTAASHVPPNDLLEIALVYGDRAKLHLHPTAVVNNAIFNLSSGEITVGEYAFFGHSVSVLTGTHDVTTFDRERQVAVPKSGRDVVIERGAWVSSNALVLGPCRIGEHAVVAAGSVVTTDVAPYTIVAGVPAKPVKTIPRPDEAEVQPPDFGEDEPPAAVDDDAVGGLFAAVQPAFHGRFRGSEADVRERLAVYLDDVERVRTGSGVLDIGPGRGEWLSLLEERGVPAYGVELNAAMVQHLQLRGLRVEQGDAVAHLEGLEPAGLDVVSAIHVVEHLELEVLLRLLSAARRAVRPGGLLLLETPDPTNLVMGACNFYLDPTHQRPLPPAQLEFFVREAGFADVELRRLHPKEDVDLSGLRLDGVDERTSELLRVAWGAAFFGPQDYAVLATAP